MPRSISLIPMDIPKWAPNKGKRITDAEIAQIRKLAAKGTKLRDIAVALGRTTSSVYAIARNNGISLYPVAEEKALKPTPAAKLKAGKPGKPAARKK